MSGLRPTDPVLFFSKNDPDDPRLGEFATQPADTANVEIFGWPDDEGIRLNGGRPGAAEGPSRIRKFLYKMTPSVSSVNRPNFGDHGNLHPEGRLPERHEFAREKALAAYRRQHAVLSFGGGHDYGFPDAAAFLDRFATTHVRPLVINFDAHLDVRPAGESPHSGTPFRRLLDEFTDRFDFLEIGLQPHCNSRVHFEWARSRGAELWMADDVRSSEALQARLISWLGPRADRPLFVSLDIDSISSVSAPGCSASWDRGLTSDRVFEALALLDRKTQWRGFGIYEVSPPLDVDDRTSKLAALYAFDFITRRS